MSLGIAYRYASLGLAVFPLAPNSKKPRIAIRDGGRGCHDATVDREQIEAWWTQWPTANVGMATGPISGCWALDVDPQSSGEGEAWLAGKEAEFGKLPITPESRTLKGGRHLLFKWNPEFHIHNRAGIVPGLDARGDGGYIVAAPSYVKEVKSGVEWAGRYAWLEDCKPSAVPIAAAPAWLLEAVMNKPQAQVAEEFVPRERRQGDGFRYGHKALEIECQSITTAPIGQQDNQIVSSAFKIGQLVAGGEIPAQDAEDALVNAAMAIPGQSKSSAVIIDKVKRALEAGSGKPRRAPERPSGGKPQLRVVGGSAVPAHDPETGEIYEARNEPPIEDWALGLAWSLTKEGNLKPQSLKNVELMLSHHPDFKGRMMLNDFSYKVWIVGGLPCDRGEPPVRIVSDHDYVSVAAWMNTVGLAPSITTVGSMMSLVASRDTFDPVKKYLTDLKWDGEFRIKDWLATYAGAEPTEYTQIVGQRFLISAVARVFKPGSKVDTMLVLEGPQGLKKSTLARGLFGSEWFSDQVGDVTSKESSIQIQGLWAVEVAEMDSFNRADDKAVKSFLSRIDDRYRPTFGINTIERPRRCVFIGTYNPDGHGIIKDSTGARRYWFVACRKIDIEAAMRDRDQLWAEAVEHYQVGEQWWLEPHEEVLAKAEQLERQEADLWDDNIGHWLREKLPGMTFRAAEVVHEALAIPIERRDSRTLVRVGKILSKLGCVPARPYDDDGRQYRAWMKPETETET